MVNRKQVSVNNQAIYNILASVILSGIGFLTTPLFTRALGAEHYGYYVTFHAWMQILLCFMGLHSESGLQTARYKFENEYDSFRSSVLLLGTLISGVMILLVAVFINPVSKFLGYTKGVTMVLVLSSFAHYIVEFARGAFIYEKKAKLNFIISVSLSAITVVLSLLLLNVFDESQKFYSKVFGVSIPYIIIAILLWIGIFTKKPSGYKPEFWKYSLGLGIPIVFHSLSQRILGQSDRVMLQYMGYAGAPVGIYGFFGTYAGIMSIILQALNTSWCPFYYDDLNKKLFDKLKVKTRNYLELFTILACGFILLSREFYHLFADGEFYSGMSLLPINVLGIYFTFMYQFPVNFEFFNRKTKIIAIGTCASGVVNIVLNALLIPRMGMYGAAIATTISYAALFVAHYIIVHHLPGLQFHMKIWQFLPWLGMVLVTSVLFYILKDLWLVRWLLGAALGVYLILRVYKRKTIF